MLWRDRVSFRSQTNNLKVRKQQRKIFSLHKKRKERKKYRYLKISVPYWSRTNYEKMDTIKIAIPFALKKGKKGYLQVLHVGILLF